MVLGRPECLLLSEALGQPRKLARLYFKSLLGDHALDLELTQVGLTYVAVVREIKWERVLGEHHFTVVWNDIDEPQRFSLLWFVCEQASQGAARSIAMADAALRLAQARWGTTG
jgi:hypothetical protein